VHLCVDMQRIFSTEGPWSTPWMERVLPVVVEIARRHPERTVFTRFITPERPQDMPGMWQHYYRRWEETTRERMNPSLLELLPELARFCPPAVVLSKIRYSGFAEPHLLAHLHSARPTGSSSPGRRPMCACSRSIREVWRPRVCAVWGS
jgi:nicotinamidase-related amidase